ncbi:PREDICTED: uncharacterized protein LOC108965881 [Bactrocera latifrons]|uniref:Uncharacterized protein n=1 Tax=Bactrocera latifrons TaxID=174628 RepID=A0A0K8U1Z4_BACLA|nr:PREDICTED: uncharacterized protein LOC108965881 [Bactrocera latifrons]XP_018784099.1 PREDICTED: uncharacterized protein LOC108965881 [Bactrocera latifrons]
MNAYIEQAMEKVTDLQQQTHFCINNYDYYHKNNEFEILRQKEKQLRVSAIYLKEFLNTLDAFQDAIQDISSQCDEIDVLLEKCTQKGKKDETDSNKENI